ncbi:putative Mitochondrial import receptor subunit ATOM69 [Trypanosoma cruzi]|uniref:Putative Mitochondrial import receptor subunit ATOM69 n=1 Tax=Trypanosoma cruzi TaxID=5693 RepID=A0A2V2UP58_TRYCR|nr:putative Mitochondrial import receptor subunit ATOM69 [Trypanosoma cruzi]
MQRWRTTNPRRRKIQKKLIEVTNTLEAGAEGEVAKRAQSQRDILEEMLRLHIYREKRAQPATLANFIEITQLDICKARINVGAMEDEEKEEYASETESAMTAHELMATGLKHFEQQEIQMALHFLRLAAIHHNHEQSILLLHSIYTQLQSPRGPFLLLKRALNDDDFSTAANLKVGEQFDTGARHFPSYVPGCPVLLSACCKGWKCTCNVGSCTALPSWLYFVHYVVYRTNGRSKKHRKVPCMD